MPEPASPERAPDGPERRVSWTARVLAPLALIALVLAVLITINSSVGNDSDESEPTSEVRDRAERAARDDAEEEEAEEPEKEETYVVQPGDSLSTIADELDLTIEELEELNPDVDPEALASGERLKIG